MGLSRAGEIADGLLEAGMDPETPASVLSCAFMPNERRVDGRLDDLARIAGEVTAPAILVIGKTAAMHLESPRMPLKTDTAAEKTAQPAPTVDAVQTVAAEEDMNDLNAGINARLGRDIITPTPFG